MPAANIDRKPVPIISPETEPYWRAARDHELVVQKCRSCGQVIFFPRIICFRCLGDDLQWIRATGYGTVYSYTVIHQAVHAGFQADTPYVYAIIELEEGVRMLSNLVRADPEQVTIGTRVKVVFEDVTADISIPQFEPVQSDHNLKNVCAYGPSDP